MGSLIVKLLFIYKKKLQKKRPELRGLERICHCGSGCFLK
jgi:hypothetical protein